MKEATKTPALSESGEAAEEAHYTLQTAEGERSFTLDELLALAQKGLQAEDPLADTPQLKALLDAYPGLTELPAEVERAIKEGAAPLDAYRAHENAALKKQLADVQQKQHNAAAPGALQGDAEDAELDALMAVFNSVFH